MSYSVEELYKMWLKGRSLRSLGMLVGKPHGSIHTMFRKHYGESACNLKAKSLVRSLVEDYEDKPEVITWALSLVNDESEQYFKSNHSLSQLTAYQTLRETYILDTVEAPEVDDDASVWGFVRLPFYLEIIDSILVFVYIASLLVGEEVCEVA